MSKLIKNNKLCDNRLSSKVYYHSDTWSVTSQKSINTILNNSKDAIKNISDSNNSISSRRISVFKNSNNELNLQPLSKSGISQCKGSSKSHNMEKKATETNVENPLMDDTMNEVLNSLENLKTTNPSNDEYSKDFSRIVHKTFKKSIENTNEFNNHLANRLNYLQLINPNPATKMPKIKSVSTIPNLPTLDSMEEDECLKLYYNNKRNYKPNRRSTMRKTTVTKNLKINNNNPKIMFFSNLDVDQFITEFIENLNYLSKIKQNRKLVGGVIKNFLEYSDFIGNMLLNHDKTELRRDINHENIKEKLINKNYVQGNEQSHKNDELYDIELLIKLYYFNLAVQKFIENVNKQSSLYQNEKFNESFKKFKRVEQQYLHHLKETNYKKYEYCKETLENNKIPQIIEKKFDILKQLEKLEYSIGKLPLISPKTRLICEYTNNLIQGRDKYSHFN